MKNHLLNQCCRLQMNAFARTNIKVFERNRMVLRMMQSGQTFQVNRNVSGKIYSLQIRFFVKGKFIHVVLICKPCDGIRFKFESTLLCAFNRSVLHIFCYRNEIFFEFSWNGQPKQNQRKIIHFIRIFGYL